MIASLSSRTRHRVIYDRLAARYDWAMRPLERWFLSRWRERTLRALPVDGCILEVGAGTGSNFPYYPRGAHGVASEVSREMLLVARGKPRPQRVQLVQSCAESLPFADDSFDAAFATLVFCSVASPARGFAELRRVVRAGGTIALLEHVRPEGLLLGLVFDALSIFTVALFEDHFNRRTAAEAERAGLKLLSVERRAFGIIELIVCRA
jgi:phosphatidylethanolamine/phosphatidyl-N-methylethanolamine N-methyltransferase